MLSHCLAVYCCRIAFIFFRSKASLNNLILALLASIVLAGAVCKK
jgi:hypothetical protein